MVDEEGGVLWGAGDVGADAAEGEVAGVVRAETVGEGRGGEDGGEGADVRGGEEGGDDLGIRVDGGEVRVEIAGEAARVWDEGVGWDVAG